MIKKNILRFIGCLTLSVPAVFVQAIAQSNELQPADLETLGTASVAETLAELKKDPARAFVNQSGWLVGEKRIDGGSELWSFVPEGHDAYPSAIQRLITDGDGGLQIAMTIQCDAIKIACAELDNLFTVMNENLIGVSKNVPPVREPDPQTGGALEGQ